MRPLRPYLWHQYGRNYCRASTIVLIQSTGHPLLDEEAVSAVKRMVFQPYKEDGVPQGSWVTIPITFKLNE